MAELKKEVGEIAHRAFTPLHYPVMNDPHYHSGRDWLRRIIVVMLTIHLSFRVETARERCLNNKIISRL